MATSGSFGYAHEDGLTVVTLDYLGRDLQFVIVLPAAGQTPAAAGGNLHYQKNIRVMLLFIHVLVQKIKYLAQVLICKKISVIYIVLKINIILNVV
jgi:hypothetical protein